MAAGLTSAQHQLLLAIRGHGDPHGPTIGEVATCCCATTARLASRIAPTLRDLSSGQEIPDDHRVVRPETQCSRR